MSRNEDASCYCHAFEENKIKYITPCSKCGKWYHEECVGLPVDDRDNSECPHGF